MNKEEIKSSNIERAPLKREAPRPLESPGIPRTPVTPPGVLDIFRKKSSVNFDQNTGFHGGPSAKRKGYRLALWSMLASVIDGLILISVSSIFMMAFALVVKTSMGGFVQDMFHHEQRMILFGEIFAVAAWMYLIGVRVLMGSTIGEWACELRLGQPQERLKSGYVLRVAWRSTIIVVTGVITLPLCSMIFGRDLAGILSGLRLFSLK